MKKKIKILAYKKAWLLIMIGGVFYSSVHSMVIPKTKKKLATKESRVPGRRGLGRKEEAPAVGESIEELETRFERLKGPVQQEEQEERACEMCTYLNPPGTAKCQMCEAELPVQQEEKLRGEREELPVPSFRKLTKSGLPKEVKKGSQQKGGLAQKEHLRQERLEEADRELNARLAALRREEPLVLRRLSEKEAVAQPVQHAREQVKERSFAERQAIINSLKNDVASCDNWLKELRVAFLPIGLSKKANMRHQNNVYHKLKKIIETKAAQALSFGEEELALEFYTCEEMIGDTFRELSSR